MKMFWLMTYSTTAALGWVALASEAGGTVEDRSVEPNLLAQAAPVMVAAEPAPVVEIETIAPAPAAAPLPKPQPQTSYREITPSYSPAPTTPTWQPPSPATPQYIEHDPVLNAVITPSTPAEKAAVEQLKPQDVIRDNRSFEELIAPTPQPRQNRPPQSQLPPPQPQFAVPQPQQIPSAPTPAPIGVGSPINNNVPIRVGSPINSGSAVGSPIRAASPSPASSATSAGISGSVTTPGITDSGATPQPPTPQTTTRPVITGGVTSPAPATVPTNTPLLRQLERDIATMRAQTQRFADTRSPALEAIAPTFSLNSDVSYFDQDLWTESTLPPAPTPLTAWDVASLGTTFTRNDINTYEVSLTFLQDDLFQGDWQSLGLEVFDSALLSQFALDSAFAEFSVDFADLTTETEGLLADFDLPLESEALPLSSFDASGQLQLDFSALEDAVPSPVGNHPLTYGFNANEVGEAVLVTVSDSF